MMNWRAPTHTSPVAIVGWTMILSIDEQDEHRLSSDGSISGSEELILVEVCNEGCIAERLEIAAWLSNELFGARYCLVWLQSTIKNPNLM
jgi:hypothetical protein